MSRSDTYRPAFLTEERRRELAEQARVARLRADVLVVMQQRLTTEAEAMARGGGLSSPAQRRFVDQVATATDVSVLRGLASDLAWRTAPDRVSAAPRVGSAPSSIASQVPLAGAAPPVVATAPTVSANAPTSAGAAPPAASAPSADSSSTPPPMLTAPRLHQAPVVAPTAPMSSTVADPTEQWVRSMAEVRFDIAELDSELVSIARAADGLGLDVGDISDVRRHLDAAAEAHDQQDLDLAAAHVRGASDRIAALGHVVDEALIQTEERARMVEAVEQTLAEMGCRVTGITSVDEATVVQLDRSDGLVGEVRVVSEDGRVGCSSSFDDLADAVAPDDPAAGEPCVRAGIASADFQRRLEAQPGIEVGRLEAEVRATRGAATPPSASRTAGRAPRARTASPSSNPNTRSPR